MDYQIKETFMMVCFSYRAKNGSYTKENPLSMICEPGEDGLLQLVVKTTC